MLETLLVAHAVAFALTLARVSGFLVVSPFPGQSVGRAQRAGLAAVLSLFVLPLVGVAPDSQTPLALSLGVATLRELLCGLSIGAAFRMLYVAAEFLGQVTAQSVGLSMASVLNPSIGGEDVALGRIITLLAELLAVSVGVHRVALAYVLHSFRILPVGSTMSLSATSRVLVDLVIRSLAVGVQLAMPVIAVGLIVHIGLAMIARAAPALQILHVGLSLVLAAGLLTLNHALPDIGRQLLSYYDSLGGSLEALLAALAGA